MELVKSLETGERFGIQTICISAGYLPVPWSSLMTLQDGWAGVVNYIQIDSLVLTKTDDPSCFKIEKDAQIKGKQRSNVRTFCNHVAQ